MKKALTYNIGFHYCCRGAEDVIHDETQFDVMAEVDNDGCLTLEEAESVYDELIMLFNDFCDENDFEYVQVYYIEYVKA